MFLFVSLFVMNLTVFADDDKPIQVSQMPKEAQAFVQKHFGNLSVAVAKVENDLFGKNYDIIFTNGDKVEFDKTGNWTNVDCEHTQVPVEIIPQAIQEYVTKNYPQAKVVKIEKTDRKGYDVDLSNGFDLEFDKKFRVVEIDR